jgi:hypothetical protein
MMNTAVMPTFLNILFSKTNIYEFETVQATFKILDAWFHCIHENNKRIGSTAIERRFFVQGIRVTILSEICMNVANALCFVYKNYHML